MASTKEHSLLVRATTENIAHVRNFVANHAAQCGFTLEDTDSIRLAVDEAYTNVIKHAYDFDETKMVNVKVMCGDDGFHIIISDHGRSYDPDLYKEPNIEERIKLRKRGGVGVFLIQKLMDQVEYRKVGSLNEIVMTKKL